MRLSLDQPANHRPSRVTIVVAAAVATALLGILLFVAAVAPHGVPLVPYRYVDAQFDNASNLQELSAVQIAGRQVGQVTSVKYADGVDNVMLQMLPGTQPLTTGATIRIRLKNPIGAKYVEVTPSAHGAVLANHAIVPTSHTSTAVDTQELLSEFTGPTRTNLTKSVIGLGQGFIGRGTGINEELPIAGPELKNLEAVSQSILAVPHAASDFAPAADSLASAYDPVRTQLTEGFDPQSQVLQDFGIKRTALQQTLDVAPASLSALKAGLAQADPLLAQTTGLARAAIRLTRPAPAAFVAATQLMRTGVPSLQRSLPLLKSVDNAVSPTLALLDRSYPVLTPTDTVLQEQLHPLTNLVAHDCDFLNETENWRSAMSMGVPGNSDPLSHLTTLEPGLGPDINSFRVLALAPTTTETLDADAPGNFAHGTDAYPAPCAANGEVLK